MLTRTRIFLVPSLCSDYWKIWPVYFNSVVYILTATAVQADSRDLSNTPVLHFLLVFVFIFGVCI